MLILQQVHVHDLRYEKHTGELQSKFLSTDLGIGGFHRVSINS